MRSFSVGAALPAVAGAAGGGVGTEGAGTAAAAAGTRVDSTPPGDGRASATATGGGAGTPAASRTGGGGAARCGRGVGRAWVGRGVGRAGGDVGSAFASAAWDSAAGGAGAGAAVGSASAAGAGDGAIVGWSAASAAGVAAAGRAGRPAVSRAVLRVDDRRRRIAAVATTPAAAALRNGVRRFGRIFASWSSVVAVGVGKRPEGGAPPCAGSYGGGFAVPGARTVGRRVRGGPEGLGVGGGVVCGPNCRSRRSCALGVNGRSGGSIFGMEDRNATVLSTSSG